MGNPFQGKQLFYFLYNLLNRSQILKGRFGFLRRKNLLLLEQTLFFKSRSYFKNGLIVLESKQEVSKVVSLVKLMKKNIKVYSFTLTLLHSERPKLYRVLALLSAIRLSHQDKQIYTNSKAVNWILRRCIA